MSLLLLKRSIAEVLPSGIAQFLLVPDLAPEALYGPLYDAIRLASIWRLRRQRPYVVGSIDEEQGLETLRSTDIEFLRSLPVLRIEGGDSSRSVRYVGVDDLSLFLPHFEEDFLLFFPAPPPEVIPRWPQFVTDLDALYVTQVDEFMKLQTVDQGIIDLLQGLPEFGVMPDPNLR
jgi:hypothetical protein